MTPDHPDATHDCKPLCGECWISDDKPMRSALDIEEIMVAVRCDACNGSGVIPSVGDCPECVK